VRDVIVVGAGVAGLACARRLSSAGADVLVLDRADKPGGRCATRWTEGLPFDYGPQFLHGADPSFLSCLASVDARRVEGWPRRVEGRGTPCQPDAFAPHQTRLAFEEGLHSLPRDLARGLPLTLNTLAVSLSVSGGAARVLSAAGESFEGRDLVLALALEQALPFLHMLPAEGGRDGMLALLSLFASSPCLTVTAVYPPGTPAPAWDIMYPEDEPSLLLVGHDSAKRPGAPSTVLVCQGSARWSRSRLEAPVEQWTRELLAAVARRVGGWAGKPQWVRSHRWRHSRVDRANELAGPVVLHAGGCRVGVAGDLFTPGGGVQAAWMSGDRLGERLRAEAEERAP
jgi:renalase